MSSLIDRLAAIAQQPGAPVIEDRSGVLSLAAALDQAATLAGQFRKHHCRVVAIHAENSRHWIVADLALLIAGCISVPIPAFFTPAQVDHVLARTGADAWLGTHAPAGFEAATLVSTGILSVREAGLPDGGWPEGAVKVTFTSGTTGQAKGVVLDETLLLAVAESLAQRTAPLGIGRHLSILPFPILLENVAGIYAPLLAAADVVVASNTESGLAPDMMSFEPEVLLESIRRTQADSVIALPQMLNAMVGAIGQRERALSTLKLVAVGGAPVAAAMQQRAHACGLPVLQGYGLSEFGSVVALQVPGKAGNDCCGPVLPHLELRCSDRGELEIRGPRFLGYLGDPASARDRSWWPTGDRARIESDGTVQILGRLDNVIVTPMGRNVSPEWVETALVDHTTILQAVVLGDGELHALVYAPGAISDEQVAAQVRGTNACLPAYAAVAHWHRLEAPMRPGDPNMTANGRPRRDVLRSRLPVAQADAIESKSLQEITA